MPLLTTKGAGSASSLGITSASSAIPYIEDVFSCFLYTGNGSTQTINNGIDLAGKGGMVWVKRRDGANDHALWDTARVSGANEFILVPNNTDAYTTPFNWLTYNNDGFTISAGASGQRGGINDNGNTQVSWTFRKQPKFFDVVTYTGNGAAGQTINHNLGSVPGVMVVKKTSTTGDWAVYHRSLGATQICFLNDTQAAGATVQAWNNTEPTSTQLTVGVGYNASGQTYVAYLFAHDAGGFGLSGTDNVISCGSYVGTGGALNINLGYEPQWIMVKAASANYTWMMVDNMRGCPASPNYASYLQANSSDAEIANAGGIHINSTGFNVDGFGNDGGSGITYIYIAIRRGPMKVPTLGTSVFSPTTYTGNGATGQTITSVGFPLDFVFDLNRDSLDNKLTLSRLTADNGLYTNNTDGQNPLGSTAFRFDVMTGFKLGNNSSTNGNGTLFVAECFRRAPSFFDEVCYTGTGAAMTVSHNLGAVPELMIVKGRNIAQEWDIYVAPLGATKYLRLHTTSNESVSSSRWNNTIPSSTNFTVGTDAAVNANTYNYVAYLFATCPGVSKVGSYTGTSATLQIDCGFTSGVRFVLIKRTNSNGGWFVWDSARGIVSGNDPYLRLESTSAEVTNTDYIDSYSAGFELNASASDVNNSGDTFIFLAIA